MPQGVLLRDENGNVILNPNNSSAVILGSVTLYAGRAAGAYTEYTVQAPPNINFTLNKPFVIAPLITGLTTATYYIQGTTVYSNGAWVNSYTHAWYPIWHKIIATMPSYFTFYLKNHRQLSSDVEFLYGYS